MRHWRDEKTGAESGGERLPKVNVLVYEWGGNKQQG